MTDTIPPNNDSEWLTGGNMNAVERIGDTVHRAAGPWTPTIHRLLDHLHKHKVGWLPRPLGYDIDGREVLSYPPGYVPAYPFPAWIWDDGVLISAVRRMAEFHDATTAFTTPDDVWQLPAHAPAEVVCHNDFAPYNMVFADDHTLTGVIDCDTASPGPRVWGRRLPRLSARALDGAGQHRHSPDTGSRDGATAPTRRRRLRPRTHRRGHRGSRRPSARRPRDLHRSTGRRQPRVGRPRGALPKRRPLDPRQPRRADQARRRRWRTVTLRRGGSPRSPTRPHPTPARSPGGKRLTMVPSGAIRNFSKFHCTSPASPSPSGTAVSSV